MIRFLTVFSLALIKKVLQRIIVLAIVVVIISLMGTGVLAEPWNEFDLFVQDFGWGEETLVSPVSNPNVEVRLIQVPNPPGDPDNFIQSCIFHSAVDIPAGTGLAQGSAICKLLDDQGLAIAEGRSFFLSYTASDDLEVFISQMVFPGSNNNELIFDIKFIIQKPI